MVEGLQTKIITAANWNKAEGTMSYIGQKNQNYRSKQRIEASIIQLVTVLEKIPKQKFKHTSKFFLSFRVYKKIPRF